MTPADLATVFGAAVVQVLPYVGAAVGAALGVMFALIGIRSGLRWAANMLADRVERNAYDDALWAAEDVNQGNWSAMDNDYVDHSWMTTDRVETESLGDFYASHPGFKGPDD